MQKQQVFKVKGMQRDLSMANTNGEFAYEIVNMRLLPAEENAGLSLTNEKGTLQIPNLQYEGTVIGQCPTNDSLVFFTCDPEGDDYIYELYQEEDTWKLDQLFKGNLNFSIDNKIEAICNYETLDIQKIYWIDGYNQLRCINIVESPTNWGMQRNTNGTNWEPGNVNNQYFDSVKEINSLPSVEIERVSGGSFTAGVLQYYITYFNEFSAESPIIYTSPLLYIAHSNRGANTNDQVSTAFKLTLTELDTVNWGYIRIYATHRTSLDATPEGSIITEVNIPENGTIEFTDFGNNRTSIAPTDLYFTGGKFVKAGTMAVKDQVMFLGNLDIESSDTIDYTEIKELFDSLRASGDIDNFFSTETRKQIDNDLEEYKDTYYTYKNKLNNTESITHYKYGEKYRFGISVMDKYGVWSNPIWIKDEFILTPPEQTDEYTLELPCPSLDLSGILEHIDNTPTLWEYLQSKGVKNIKPLIVFPSEEERKVIAQGVVCPTVYNLKDRKENGPYAQASWFMRPNAPVDLWGIQNSILGTANATIYDELKKTIYHKSDLFSFNTGHISNYDQAGYYGAASVDELPNGLSGFNYLYDDFSTDGIIQSSNGTSKFIDESTVNTYRISNTSITSAGQITYNHEDQEKTYKKGTWVEFRHNYALRSKGWSFGDPTLSNAWLSPFFNSNGVNKGMVRGAELDVSRFDVIPPTNRFINPYSSSEETTTLSSDDAAPENLYFVTTISPKSFHQQQKDGEQPSILVYYKYTGTHGSKSVSVLKLIDTIQMPKEKADKTGRLYTTFGSPWEYINIPEALISGDEGADTWTYLCLRLKRSASPEHILPNEPSYYVWTVRDISDITKDSYIEKYWPTEGVNIQLNEKEDGLYYGDRPISETSLGNASYYVDNSIVTLNSPDIELQEKTYNLGNTDFRILGIIPLTATASDISVKSDNPSSDTQYKGTGLLKRTYSNTNIGYHGFKGIVGSNAYITNTENTIYSVVQLSPWQSTGTLGLYKNDGDAFKTKDILKQKILSNLRYSAATHFFPPNGAGVINNLNKAMLNNKPIGWKPGRGCFIQSFKEEDASSIIKLEELNYTNPALVYKGNIDSIALLTKGSTNSLYKTPIYSFGQDVNDQAATTYDVGSRINMPATGLLKETEEDSNTLYTKTSQGASIKYKSSPHFVIGFKCFDTYGNSPLKMQETLPALASLNHEGLNKYYYGETNSTPISDFIHGRLYEDENVSSLYHQSNLMLNIPTDSYLFDSGIFNLYRKGQEYDTTTESIPNYGWLWLGEIYRETDPTFGGTSNFALENNSWENAGDYKLKELEWEINKKIERRYKTNITDFDYHGDKTGEGSWISYNSQNGLTFKYEGADLAGKYEVSIYTDSDILNLAQLLFANDSLAQLDKIHVLYKHTARDGGLKTGVCVGDVFIIKRDNKKEVLIRFADTSNDISYTLRVENFPIDVLPVYKQSLLQWTVGDTYYQRFDTLKTYAYDENAQNSIIDITSFMVETRVNVDGRYDRNRGQESNLQMSPSNFNLMNDVYSQRDNFFTYRILDDDVQARTKFPNQITWSLSKTAGATVDTWMNITLASVLDLDGAEGELKALKTFNNSIVAFQESGISQILFNSRVQIPTSEMVPIQIANSGKVDGQQFISRDVGCQDKWAIVTTPMGLYFVDYFNKSIYRFNGQLEDLSSSKGFRGWCDKYINSNSTIVGYYDVNNREVMYYNSNFRTDSFDIPVWLGYSELTNNFSAFYTYPDAVLSSIKGEGIWLYNNTIHKHQQGAYNNLLGETYPYGLTVVTRQDSNTVKTFNNVEFRADTYNGATLLNDKTFNSLDIWTENDGKTPSPLSYSQYRPSTLKKMLRTWRANIPRVNNGYKRYVNQWAKVGLWKTDCTNEKTILHDLSVIYSE